MTQEAEKRVILTPASMIRPRRQKWLWAPAGDGVIPLGTGTICAGKGGEGKTTFMLDLAAQLTRGDLPGDLLGTRGSVIILGPEDDWDTIMVPRLLAAEADLDRVFAIEVKTITDALTTQRELRFPLDTSELEEAVVETGARLVIIDPAPALMHGDMNKVQDVRAAYGPLMAMAQKREMSLAMINHFGKAAGSVSNKLSGSHAWRDITRSFLAFATEEETGERILTQDKNNYGTGTGSYKFVLDSVGVPTDEGVAEVARVRFLGASEVTVSDVIDRERSEGDDDDDRNAAQAFLLDHLRAQPGHEGNAGDAIKAGMSVGFTRDDIKNARKRCRDPRIVSEKSKTFTGGWVWRVEEEGAEEGALHPESDTLDALEAEMAGNSTVAANHPEGVTEVAKVSKASKASANEDGLRPDHDNTSGSPCPHGLLESRCFQCKVDGRDAA